MSYYIHAGKFFLENRTEKGGYLEVQDDGNFGLYYREDEKPSHGLIKEYGDQWIAPGYVDTHIHGLIDEDTMKSDWEGIDKISNGLLQAGVTSWLPTTITASDKELTETCEKFAAHKGEETGAKIQGLHFEGPFFTPKHGGAENPKYMTDPSIMLLKKWRKASDDMLIKISMAPERKNARQFVREAVKMGLVVALGHSDSNFEDAIGCVEAGASVFTHTFNGMNSLSQHSPNIIGAAFSSRLTTDELICDGHHVEEPAVRALVNARGPEHIALITDCMQAGLMPDGDYVLGELPVYVKDGMARLKETNNLAGSILLLKDAVKNVVDWNVATPEDAVMMASYVPAKSCNLLDKCGVIKPDHPADFVVLNHDMTVSETYLNGESRYKA
ncbi:N-acetylglucosamine-6-phosphate deacetylase [Lactobacillus johnsonii]|uniref:N-acetylglucosamine-6-phosphate deacetylase n=1 Tax=Lactobacillus johnsonii TaxID=33959 RepID=A0A267M6F4_LACJH|nr:N-acetylglucosamine-6-phosphate deacetylase [Lactobacillus johnsonii]MBZ4029038.1 N-acetylglucosamine-6-phosphate deacetylase [Lactobacillus johnsonii]MCL5443035.1 N-acetylglucosamine-6-phosphate deacetylase [Lactobacillus johnsonii]PAB50740.1 N-acetylglucosamine-6-phosphate deacetylase [Lactobacillus johnsonii]PAB55027.1 N-acetylglucosamine-6-phosphate deacetylase [Lactobacillus johnsonii]HJE49988.1 N-acetylglucosamine-6-phosphate deacetylase [Lactobacillus johnsonii]